MDRRQHLIGSLDTLLYQLHTLSFFLAPALLPLLARIAAQAHCRPRPDDAHSLRFYLALVLVLNVPSLWYHATRAPHDDRAVVLDFVGLAYVPSKLHLVSLDAFIIFLQSVLTCIAYETALSSEPDILRPPETKDSHSQYVIDMRFKPLLSRLRNPPPIRQSSSLPLPNTTPWSLPTGMGMALLRAGRRVRTERRLPGALDSST
ncbi:hypothetical protein AX14_013392 [Amanita brunnescens Koide BX004]|nr:hypothetical protein AX14_013392 [Amanita brunnescens Koide BX004]